MNPADLMTVPQASKYLGVSPQTIRRHIAAGRLPAVRMGPRLTRIRRDDLDALIQPMPVDPKLVS